MCLGIMCLGIGHFLCIPIMRLGIGHLLCIPVNDVPVRLVQRYKPIVILVAIVIVADLEVLPRDLINLFHLIL